ncbi:MAG TPA: hypothetical protein VLC11_04500 [Gemmatimonadales bacterium]|nr:hypothetical protein [Gemmatimonadales bacterium]
MLVLWISRRPLPAIAPDSVSYLGAGMSLARNGALRVPFNDWTDADSTAALTDYAPGYPMVLAIPIAAGVAPATAARWIQALAAGAALAIALALLDAVAGSVAALLGLPLLLLLPALTDIHLWILSEPLFIAVMVATLTTMVRRPDRPLAYGALAALGNLVRFAGVALVGAAGLWAMAQAGERRQRITRGALAAGPGVLLQAWWYLRKVSPAGGIGGAGVSGLGGTLRQGAATIGAWLVPVHLSGPWRAIVVALVALALIIVGWRVLRSTAEGPRRLLRAVAVVAVCYVAMLLFARIRVAPDVPFDSRILGPIIVALAIAAAAALAAGWRERPAAVRVVIPAIVLAWSVAAGAYDASTIRLARRFGLGYESLEWQMSPIAGWLRGPGSGRTIYTSDPAGTWAIIHRPSRFVPSSLSPDTVARFAAAFAARPSALIALPPELAPQASADSLAARLGLVAAAHTAFGTVWIRR